MKTTTETALCKPFLKSGTTSDHLRNRKTTYGTYTAAQPDNTFTLCICGKTPMHRLPPGKTHITALTRPDERPLLRGTSNRSAHACRAAESTEQADTTAGDTVGVAQPRVAGVRPDRAQTRGILTHPNTRHTPSVDREPSRLNPFLTSSQSGCWVAMASPSSRVSGRRSSASMSLRATSGSRLR